MLEDSEAEEILKRRTLSRDPIAVATQHLLARSKTYTRVSEALIMALPNLVVLGWTQCNRSWVQTTPFGRALQPLKTLSRKKFWQLFIRSFDNAINPGMELLTAQLILPEQHVALGA